MLQVQATWDLESITPTMGLMKLHILFLFITCIVAVVKLMRIWPAVRPFAKLPIEQQSSALPLLHTTASSLGRWIGLTFLTWGIATSVTIVNFCQRIQTWKELSVWGGTVLQVSELLVTLTFALVVVTFLYLIRWRILNRIERFRK